MGVRGLSTYLSHRETFFEDLELKNTRVIIDGDNLRFALYKWCPGLNHCFGGDYDKYYRYVQQFFKRIIVEDLERERFKKNTFIFYFDLI